MSKESNIVAMSRGRPSHAQFPVVLLPPQSDQMLPVVKLDIPADVIG